MKNIGRAVALSVAALSIAGITPSKATETVLYRFTGGNDGAYPQSRLIADKEGALYGTTEEGGSYGYGTVFKLTPPAPGHQAWTETVLYSFCSQSSCADGSYPKASLVADAEGALYGTTYEGGTFGYGSVFRLTPPAPGHKTWTQTVLNSFVGFDDGSYPMAGVIFGKDGALYGTTSEGGYGPNSIGYGTVFQLVPPAPGHTSWTEVQLYTFCRVGYYCNDGYSPESVLTFGKDGALYGSTLLGGSSGGTSDCINLDGCGTIFKLKPPPQGHNTWTHTVIHNFTNGANSGAYPVGELLFGTDGAIYGAANGNYNTGKGWIFKLAPPAAEGGAWKASLIHQFGTCPWNGIPPTCPVDGIGPNGLLAGADGVLYGTTVQGAVGNNYLPPGTVFMLTPPPKNTYPTYWYETILHVFGRGQDGASPVAGLIAYQGALYGTTNHGGIGCADQGGCGTIFKVTLAPNLGGCLSPNSSPECGRGGPGPRPLSKLQEAE